MQKGNIPTLSDRKLSLGRKLDIIPASLSILLVGIFAAISGGFRGPKGTPTYFLHVTYAMMRKAVSRLSILQLQWLSPTTNEVYQQYTRQHDIIPETVELAHGSKGHWIGNKEAKNVLVWYHGGGFCLPAHMGYYKFWADIVKSLIDRDLAIFVLSYSLAPHAQYPVQLNQAVEALRFILDQTKCSASHILLGGDSAGGNLAVAVLLHIVHPHQQIRKLDLYESLAGVCVFAPWSMLNAGRDQKVDCSFDVVTPDVAEPWSRAYLGTAPGDYYTDVATAPVEWFKRLPVRQILVLGGQNEIMLPLIEDFVEKVRVGFPSVELFLGKREGHVAPVFNRLLGDNRETEQEKRLKLWLRQIL